MDNKQWYAQLNKPKWSPPSYLFGIVWSILYVFIIISFGFVFFSEDSFGKLKKKYNMRG